MVRLKWLDFTITFETQSRSQTPTSDVQKHWEPPILLRLPVLVGSTLQMLKLLFSYVSVNINYIPCIKVLFIEFCNHLNSKFKMSQPPVSIRTE